MKYDSSEPPTLTVEAAVGGTSVPGAQAEDVFVAPTSYAQQRLWFLRTLEPDSAAYNIYAAVRLEGRLDCALLDRCLEEVARRHESLRTTFDTVEGRPVQVVAPSTRLRAERTDLRALPAGEREAEALRLAREETARLFDLGRGPLLRLLLLALGDEEHMLVLSMDHIVGDSWSLTVLIREVCELYAAFAAGRPTPLPELEIQYIDYAEWQRERLQSGVLERQLDYWKRQLGGAPSVLELPTDFPRPPAQTSNGAALLLELPRELRERVEAVGRRRGATVYMTLLAAFQTLLHRYTGQTDILVGTPIAGRTQSETEGLIGFFVNTLVMRGRLAGDTRFAELLDATRATALEAHAHQDVPFEVLVEVLRPERDLSHAPFFQVMFVLQPSMPEIRLPGLTVRQVELANATAKFDLLLDIRESDDRLLATFEYNTDLFRESTVERMAGHYLTLLEAVARDPEQRLSALPLLAEEERRQLLVAFNDTAADYPRDLCVHQLFEAQAAATPDSTALIFGEESLTYGELNRRANRLAHYLLSLGVGADAPVGLCLERSAGMVVAVLAILKAGGAYLPLDPALPRERLAFMLTDAAAPLLLTESRLADELPPGCARVVFLDEDTEEVARQSDENPRVEVTPSHLAYVMYTSGSTGTPKGVCVPHRAVARLVKGSSFASFSAEEVFLHLAPPSFDASTFELWGALLNGARLVLMPAGQSSLEEIGAAINRHSVTTLWLTAGLFHLMASERPEELRGLRQLLAGGDVLSPSHVNRMLGEMEEGSFLVNGYGPTENTTFTCCHRMAAGEEGERVDGAIPVGRPIANTRVYVLDEQLEPVPIGVAGELYTSGDGLARGYLNRPALTAERFIPDPFSAEPGGRMYRTGDVARWRRDGAVEFVGRRDGQVKVRGFRVEVGEIEAALAALEGIRECVVVARGTGAEDKRLVAYVVGEEESSAGELQRRLKGRLPEYMVPSVFVRMPELPLNANGKVDRAALPEPGEGRVAAGHTSTAPRTPVEEVLAGVWAEVLGVAAVGVEDNFFELGGHSLLATQVVSRVREVFGVEVGLRKLFEEPTVAGLAAGVEALLREGREGGGAPPLVAAARAGELPLSYAQQRLWFLQQLEPSNPFYNIHAALRLTGEFDAASLERSLAEIIRRHETLRTSFQAVEGRPMQAVADAVEFRVEVEDLSALPEPERAEAARRLAFEEAQTPFDLTRAPLLRMRLLRLGDEEHVALLTMHHIVSDGWSTGVLIRELAALYRAHTEGAEPALAPLPVQYADFAAWQREWLAGGALESQLAYWKRELAGQAPALELPTDRPRPAVQTYNGATEAFELSRELSDDLKALGRGEGATLFMVLLAAFQTLLYRYTGQDDITVGTPVANRNRAETEGLIGFFVNTLALRARFDGAESFGELLRRVRETTLGAYVHQDVPFEKLVEELQPERDPSRSPLFQVMLALQNAPREELDAPGLKMSRLAGDNRTAKFDLTLEVDDAAPELCCLFEYNTDLFDADTIRRMIGHFRTLLRGIVADPGLRLADLPLLADEERHQLVVAFNDTATDYPRDKTVHQLFEAQAALTPDSTALVFGEESLTYAELNARANRLAHRLLSLGVEPDTLVGLCVERSIEMVVGLLAVLKAGGAYLPLDPALPRERLAFMLEDTRACLLLCDGRSALLFEAWRGEIVLLDGDAASVARRGEDGASADAPTRDSENPRVPVTPEHLAYVIYTSGSTGTPKGVAISHRAICNHMRWMQGEFGFGESDRVLQKTPLSFDASVWEFYAPLLSGGQLVLARPGGHRDPAYLSELMASAGVTVAQMVPSLWRALVAEPGLSNCRALRLAFSGGEALAAALAELIKGATGAAVYNLYGPTEVTIDATCGEWAGGVGEWVTIGRPVANTRAYVLGAGMSLAPAGVKGELYLGGAQVARGYLNRPGLTAERFVPDPLSGEPGARLYKTGDVVKYLPDGRLEYLGRADHQVKVRGFRIEPGEIEAALEAHAGVREARVLAREDVRDDKKLVAYVSAAEGGAAVANLRSNLVRDLRGHLKGRLPEYMVPSSFVVLDELPLTANGKVDRRALLAYDAGEAEEARGEYVAPRTPTEELLAGIWSEVLGVERVGARDNFFERGGHSLLTTQVASRVRDRLGVALPLRTVFEAPTVAELAARIEAAAREESAPASPIITVPRDRPLPLSYAQQRLWFIHQLEALDTAYTLPFAFRARGVLRAEVLGETLNEVVRRHEVLRTAFGTQAGEPVQLVAPFRRTALPLEDLGEVPEGEREETALRLAREEAQAPFDLERGPLFRARLVRLGADDHLLLLSLHHIVSDGWSLGVLVREVAALYAAFSNGEPSPLSELPVQYADFAAWQREWLRGEVLETQLSYWRRQLAGSAAALALPTDRPRPPALSFRGARLRFELPAELNDELKRLSRGEGATLFMVLLAAFQTLLYRYTGQDDITVGTPIANRQRGEIEPLIGFFVNTLALRTDLSGDPTFRQLLARVRETTLGAYAHQDVPFEKLVEELHLDRDLSRNPLFQVMFALQSAPVGELELPGLKLRPQQFDDGTARFDMEWHLWEQGGALGGILVYSTDLFDEATARRMLAHFEGLLATIVRAPEGCITELPLLGREEESLLLGEWQQTDAAFAREKCVHELFEEQAALAPDADAVVYGGARLSYRELDEHSNRLARLLRRRGVRCDDVVGVCAERSPEMMVAVLAVLKAGAAYLPLDPEYPQERLAFMLEDSGVRVLLTHERLDERLPRGGRVEHRIRLDADWHEAASEDGGALTKVALPESLAYVIYTSGSTGTPKAVAMPHRPLVNLVGFQRGRSRASARPRTLQFASLSFDVSFQETFSTLASGATLVLIGEEARRDSAALLGVLREERVERLFLPFVALHYLAETIGREGEPPPSLREVNTAGEQLKITRAVRSMFAALPGCVLDNHYGPSETHLVSAFRLEGDAADWPHLPPVGRPISNTRLYVLDQRLRPVPVGVAGELYVGGECLSRGYLKRPGATALRFVPDAFGNEAGGRLYKTGDLVRWLAAGELEFLGRADHQVKIRGFRVEPGEIEAALREHASVGDAVVLARETAGGEKRLAAYVVGAGVGAAPGVGELRGYLREKLPEYMVPAAFVVLEEFPLTPSGKVNRLALPAPGEARDEEARVYVAPRTPTEELLAGLWSEVLGVERAGADDNFFDLGGHSLLATQLMSRVREAFRIELPLRRLFESPTPAALAACVDAELRAAHELDETPLAPVERGAASATSYAQQRLWFLQQLEPQGHAYNVPAAVRLRGRLDVAALEQSLREVVRRHESLRTTFAVEGGQPFQTVAPRAHEVFGALDVLDLTAHAAEGREAEALRLAREEAQAPFDLERGPLFRARLVRLAEEEHVLLLTMHHIVSDGWSMGVLVREVTTLYDAFAAGRTSPLAELPVQYADYAAWQREWLRGEVLERQLTYWRENLSGAPPLLELPADRPRPAVQTYNGASVPFELPAELSDELKRLGRREGATVYMTLLAAFQALLHRYTGSEDIVVGSPVAGRTRPGLEGLIGFFVNTLVLRTDLSGDPEFTSLLRRVRETTLGAYQHQDVPFEKLVDELQPARDPSHTPLFQVMFALQNVADARAELEGLELQLIETGDADAKFDLTLVMSEREGALGGALVYNTDLFDADTARRLVAHFQNLLAEIAARPQRRLTRLNLLDEEERRQLLVSFNDTAADYPRDLCVHQLFEAQAAATPDSTALVFGEESLTYAELNRRANRLAHHLLSLGVGADAPVGLCLERSAGMVVAVLAVLKAGGAYLPLDPALPRERLAFMLEDARARLAVTDRASAPALEGWRGEVVMLDEDGVEVARRGEDEAEVAARSDENPVWVAVTPSHLAYVMYTSGSTGTPKGVCVPHRAVARLVKGSSFASFSAEEVFLHLAPPSFDASTFELWGALLNGARLVLMPAGQSSLEEIGAAINRHSVTTLWLTAGLFHLMASERPADLRGLRQLLAGGDVLSPSHVNRMLGEMGEGSFLVNGYGPTENTTFTCCHRMAAGDEGERVDGAVPVGRPIANTRVYVLGERLEPVPIGAAGELYTSGDGLARGYLNRPALTAERFIPDPFSAEPGGRMYRTGDVARWTADGLVEFVGRRDGQVKVRGFRVELGEVEGVIVQHAGVREAVVIVREGADGDKRLVAYVVCTGGDAPGIGELRAYARERLPEYMVPSSFVALDELPLTANGKVDRRALPEPEGERVGSEREYVAPRTPTEELLAGIFAEVLGVEGVGVEDNFFELGGHSLQAVQLVSRVREAAGADVSLRALLLAPNVAAFAREVEASLKSGGARRPSRIERAARDGELPLSFAQQRLWFLNQLEPESAAYNIPEAIRLKGVLDREALARSLAEIVRRHEVLRTTFETREGRPAQVIHAAEGLALPLVDLGAVGREEREERVRRVAEEERLRPFDLERGPLVRAHLLRLAEDEHVLLVVMHHIVSDGWSMGVLVGELSALYGAFASGEPSPLEELPVQYADYAAWQRAWLCGEVLEEQLAYWRKRLAGAPPLLELPADRPRPAVPTGRGARHAFTLPPELSDAVRRLSRREGATTFMTLLAAFQTLLHRYTGREDIVVGADVNNRRHAETERLIGFFINMLVLRTDVSGNPTFRELLGRVRETALGAYAHQDTPFERLVEELQPDRRAGHSPIFQVVFNFVGAPPGELKLKGLTLSPQEFGLGEVRFDLSLFMWDRADALGGMWTFSTDLFEQARVERMHGHFEALLASVVAEPGARVGALEYLTGAERAERAAAKSELKRANLGRFKRLKPQAVTQSRASLVKAGALEGGGHLPLVVEPVDGALDLARWAESNREFVRARLDEHGAILFRGFDLRSAEAFGEFTRSLSTRLLDYAEPSSPRTELGDKIYTSTEYPPEEQILLHNELSYAHAWPQTIYFCCLRPAERGGETPLASSRAVYELLDPEVRERFAARRVMYVRNFGEGLGLPWQHVFGTAERARAEEYCRRARIEFEWKAGDRLKTRQVRDAVVSHPRTGATVWFNQAHLFHSAGLDPGVRESLRALFREEDLPSNALYGDGSPIDDATIEEIRRAYAEATVRFAWRAGDVLMADNMLVAHGRAPFEGPRQVLVAMAEPYENGVAVPAAGEVS
jgi:amino acid adenylation domain-containing protein